MNKTTIRPFRITPQQTGVILVCAALSPVTWGQDSQSDVTASSGSGGQEKTLPTVSVNAVPEVQEPTGSTRAYTVRKTTTATGMNLSPRETPQAESVVTRAQMDDFHLNTANDVLQNATGVTVERIETDRTYYTSRGFDITNFQLDGVPQVTAAGNVHGDLDTILYDRVEILRGANGLLSGTGNPSATVNYVRKRPTADTQATFGLSYGSWNDRRLDVDVSGALNQGKTLRGRFIAAYEDKDSYLDRYRSNRTVLGGTLEGDLSDDTTVTAGVSYQRNAPKGTMWGALPMYYTNGSQTSYARSTSTATDWTKWIVETRTGFAELVHHFTDDWQTKLSVSTTDLKERGVLFYVYGTPDQGTGTGLASYPSRYDMDGNQSQVDLRTTGVFPLAGRRHDVMFGTTYSRSRVKDASAYGEGIGTALPDLMNWNGDYAQPLFDASYDGGAYQDTQRSVYAATRLHLAERWKLILGATNTRLFSSGDDYGVSYARQNSATTPYAGLLYDLTDNWSAYGSYAKIFNPQYQLDPQLQRLAPASGDTKEIGLKGELLGKRLNVNAALFNTHQRNLATEYGYVGSTEVYVGQNVRSQGYELDLSGALAASVKINAGLTGLTIKDQDGNEARTFTPRHAWHLSTTWQPLEALTLGAQLRWQGDIHRDESGGIVTRQDAYALLDLMARYDITKQWSVKLNLNNVTDKKYINSLYWSQAYYGAPINGSLSLNWKY